MKLLIKNMVCPRCVMMVQSILKDSDLSYHEVRLGEVDSKNDPTPQQIQQLNADLQKVGFEILDDQKKRQIEKVKSILIQIVQSGDIKEHISLGETLSKKLNKEYTQISRLFSEVEGITIEQFFILQKIEKVKEWLTYEELTLSEIAWKLGYSSVAHLSAQFKKVTGQTPSQFKTMGISHRQSLDNVKPRK
jgi:AraC family transcriptional regulator